MREAQYTLSVIKANVDERFKYLEKMKVTIIEWSQKNPFNYIFLLVILCRNVKTYEYE